eukprot:714685-Rhodomonas_salina.1
MGGGVEENLGAAGWRLSAGEVESLDQVARGLYCEGGRGTVRVVLSRGPWYCVGCTENGAVVPGSAESAAGAGTKHLPDELSAVLAMA